MRHSRGLILDRNKSLSRFSLHLFLCRSFGYLCVRLLTYSPVNVSIYLYVRPSARTSLAISISIYSCVSLSLHPIACPLVCPSHPFYSPTRMFARYVFVRSRSICRLLEKLAVRKTNMVHRFSVYGFTSTSDALESVTYYPLVYVQFSRNVYWKSFLYEFNIYTKRSTGRLHWKPLATVEVRQKCFIK